MLDLSQIQSQLLSKQAELEERLHKIEADFRHQTTRQEKDFEEMATARENDEVLDALGIEGQEELKQIKSALRRIEEGNYGICSQCGEAIAEARITAVPYSTLCIDCAELPQ